MFPPTAKPPEKNLVGIPYQQTLIEMFEDLDSEIKTLDSNETEGKAAAFKTQVDIVKLFDEVTGILSEDCKKCKKKYKKRCNCKNLQKISKYTKSTSKKLKKIGPGQESKFTRYALFRIQKTLKKLKKLPPKKGLLTYVDQNSTILTNKNQTRCFRHGKFAFLMTGGSLNGGGPAGSLRSMEIYNPTGRPPQDLPKQAQLCNRYQVSRRQNPQAKN